MKKLRLELWDKDPKCHWCKIPTVLWPHKDNVHPPLNNATVDHIYSKLDPRRASSSDTVLACLKCNQARNHQEFMEMLTFFRDNRTDTQALPVSHTKPIAPFKTYDVNIFLEKTVTVRKILILLSILATLSHIYWVSLIVLTLLIL